MVPSETAEQVQTHVAETVAEQLSTASAATTREPATANKTEAPITAEASAPTAPPQGSTLLEFPGVSRNKPQWRKELSERVREIQERRAREATREPVVQTQRPAEEPALPTPLGLVPQPDAPAVNPIVVAALKRLERARQPMPRARATMSGAATAVARVAEEQYQPAVRQEPELAALAAPVLAPPPQVEQLPEEKPVEVERESERERTLVVVPPAPALKATPPAKHKTELPPISVEFPDEESFEDAEATALDETPAFERYDDRAPVVSRVAGSLIDLLVVAFASSPFAAIIELTNGNWSDIRVAASMGGIFVTIMFLYLAASTALAGRTWGMSLLSIRTVDADSGLPPTTKQAVGRALLYMLSLVSFGLGIFYSLFDAEGRTAHDHLSGTAVIRD